MITNEQFRKKLQDLKDGTTYKLPTLGICENIGNASLVCQLATSWPGSTGGYHYPVKSKLIGMTAKEYYEHCSKRHILWQDQDRLALLDYLIEVTSSVIYNSHTGMVTLANGAQLYSTAELHSIRTGVI